MKILMVTSNYDDRILALLEFKKLNVAHSIDFVNNGYELVEYLNSKTNSSSELPNLLLINSNIQDQTGTDPLLMITSNPKWMKLEIVVFSTSSNLNDVIMWKEGEKPQRRISDSDELIWILREICEGLATKVGWQYQLKPRALKKGAIA